MAFEATFRYGEEVTMIDYTPGADVAAGAIVAYGDVVGIAHNKILSGVLGAIAIHGGVYSAIFGEAVAIGKAVFWDDTANKVTETTTDKPLGFCTKATAADGDIGEFFHHPEGVDAT